MKDSIFEITENTPLTETVYRMRLMGDTGEITRPGQFINIRLSDFYLRRPISVCDKDENSLLILYKVVGRGTAAMAKLPVGTKLSVLSGLGNGFDTALSGMHPLLIGGGVGIPPLYMLAKKLLAEGKAVTAVLGFNTAAEVFYADAFAALGVCVTVTTVDGTGGQKGFVTDALPPSYTYFYTCGPEAMLKAVYQKTVTSGQLSFEARMGCGFGACMGCSCKTVAGNVRICKEGPVLCKEAILWQTRV